MFNEYLHESENVMERIMSPFCFYKFCTWAGMEFISLYKAWRSTIDQNLCHLCMVFSGRHESHGISDLLYKWVTNVTKSEMCLNLNSDQ